MIEKNLMTNGHKREWNLRILRLKYYYSMVVEPSIRLSHTHTHTHTPGEREREETWSRIKKR